MTLRALALTLAVVLGGAAPAVSAHEEFGFVGTLVRIDTARNRIAVTFKENTRDETVQIALTPKTEITRDKKKVARSVLKRGLSVVVRALGDDYDTLEAVEIRIVPPLPASKK